MTSTEPVRIYVVEDERIYSDPFCRALKAASQGQMVCIGTETDGARAVTEILRLKPEIALIDLHLPESDVNGLMVGKLVMESLPECKLIAVTKDDRPYQPVTQALKIGFRGYVTKVEDFDQLLSAMRNVLAGGISISKRVSEYLTYDPFYDAVSELSAVEIEVAEFVKQGMSNRQIAQKIQLSVETVRHYVSEILSKLALDNRTQIAARVTELEQSGLWSMLKDPD